MAGLDQRRKFDLHYSDKTVVFVDVVESVRLIERNEHDAVIRIRALLHSAEELIVDNFDGRVVERRGDGLLLEFPDPRLACACAHALHQRAQQLNGGLESDLCVNLRIGVHRAKVFADADTLLGHGVNLASRITTLANVGETVVSSAIAGELVDGIDGQLHDLGRCHVKHIGHPVHAYRLTTTARAEGVVPMATPADLKPRIAVMPFLPYRGGAGPLGVGDIVTDQLISALSRSSVVGVISRLSTNALRGRKLRLDQIADRLASQFVVSGKYWSEGNQLHVFCEVARADSGNVIWTNTCSDTRSAVVQINSNLIGDLVAGISHAIFASEVRGAKSTPMPNVASHTLLLAAVNLIYRLSQDEFEHAHEALLTLQERAPRHPTPSAWLARWHLFRIVQGWSADPQKDGELAHSFAHRALDLDDQSSLALTMAGNVETSFRRDLDAAERYYDAALACNPNESLAWLQKGNARSFRGDGETALAYIEKAVQLSPIDPSRHFYDSLLASAALTAGHYDRAIAAAQSSLKMNAHHVSSHRVLAIAQALSGRLAEARLTASTLMLLEPTLTVEGFVARSPGGKSGLAQKFGSALLQAGVPPGDHTRCH